MKLYELRFPAPAKSNHCQPKSQKGKRRWLGSGLDLRNGKYGARIENRARLNGGREYPTGKGSNWVEIVSFD